MARKPPNFSWLGLTQEQTELLDFLDHLGNNGWSRNSQTEELMPKVMGNFEQVGLTVAQVEDAMRAVGYEEADLRQLRRWDSKRRTGKFGR